MVWRLLKAVNLWDDTDTVGAVAGGLAVIMYGTDTIPYGWIEKLQAKDIIEKCLVRKNNIVIKRNQPIKSGIVRKEPLKIILWKEFLLQ